MKRKLIFITVFVILGAFAQVAQGAEPVVNKDGGLIQQKSQSSPLALSDCYSLALKQSEIIAIDLDLIKETEARFVQALGALLPHITFSSFDQRLDKSTSTPRNTYERKFVVKQTLFAGFKEFAGMSASKMESKQRVNEKLRAEQLLFVDVANAFYLLMEEREDLKALQATREALIERISFLQGREKVGRSRRSEVVNVETQLYGVEAELESVKSQELLVRQLLEFLVGRDVEEVVEPDKTIPGLGSEIDYLSKAEMRSDVLASKEAWNVAKKQVAIARGDFLPTVSLESNFYTDRNTIPQDSKWDTMLSVDFPIFEGTQTYGAVNEAALKASESELSFKRIKRSTLQDIRDSYIKTKAALSRTEAYQKALTSAEENYNLQKEDYKFNLVNNLDVLQAIQQLEDARRSFIHSLYDSKRLYWQLMVSVGETLPKE